MEGAPPVFAPAGEPFVTGVAVGPELVKLGRGRVAQPSSDSITPQVAARSSSISGPKTAGTGWWRRRASALVSAA
jgi:hypothetical protein